MQKFLHDHVDLQVSALYALQVHCYNSNFPKGERTNIRRMMSEGQFLNSTLNNGVTFCLLGMLLRFFVHFYDMEIIEEEAFLAWKEDITQEFPGKGKALFQVNLERNLVCFFQFTWYCFIMSLLKLKYKQNHPGNLYIHVILHY